jgi:hypothetical protein
MGKNKNENSPNFDLLLSEASSIGGHLNQNDEQILNNGLRRMLDSWVAYPPAGLFAQMLIEMAVYAARNPTRYEQIVNDIIRAHQEAAERQGQQAEAAAAQRPSDADKAWAMGQAVLEAERNKLRIMYPKYPT